MPINPQIAASTASGTAAVASNGIRPVSFGKTSGQIYTMDIDGSPITLSAPGLSLKAPAVQPDAVTYSDVAQDTDIQYRTTPGSIKEEIVLRSAAAPQSFTFHLSDSSGRLGAGKDQADGSYAFDGRIDDTVAVTLSPAFAYQQPEGDLPPPLKAGTAHMKVTKAGDGFDIAVSVDAAWIKSQTYPVILDPTLTFSDGSGATLMGAAWPSGGSINTTSTDLGVGTFVYGSYDINPVRSYYRFDLSAIPANSHIRTGYSDTYFQQYVSYCLGDAPVRYHCDANTYNIELHQMTHAWGSSDNYAALSSSNYTAPTPITTLVQDPFTIQVGPCPGPPGLGCFREYWPLQGNGHPTLSPLTPVVQSWVNGTANNGFSAQLSTTQELSSNNLGGPIWSYRGDRGMYEHPALVVTYDPAPGAPQNVAASAGNGLSTVSWAPSSTNNGSAISSYQATLYQVGGGQIYQTSTGTSSATKAGLTNGQQYYWTVQAFNSDAPQLPSPIAQSNTVTPNADPYSAAAVGSYKPLQIAQRLIDTRTSAPVNPLTSLTVPVAGQGVAPNNVPSDGTAVAAIVNVTVLGSTSNGFLTVYPNGTGVPNASQLNFSMGQTIANLTEVALGVGGSLAVYNGSLTGTAHVIVDLEGYVTSSSQGGKGGLYNSLTPVRVASGLAVAANSTTTVQIATTGSGIPSTGVSAVAFNLTAYSHPTTSGYMVVYPNGGASPGTANITFQAGVDLSERVVVAMPSATALGYVKIWSQAATSIIIDVVGWYTDSTSQAGGALFHGLTPTRLCDTRAPVTGCPGTLGPNASGLVTLIGKGGIPATLPTSPASAIAANLTSVNVTAGVTFFSAYPSTGSANGTSDLNVMLGGVVPNMLLTQVGTDGKIRVYNNAGNADFILDVTGYYSAVAAPVAGLGLENWWSYYSRPVGPMATASVNVANGNLVVQQTDGLPVQAHGRLSYVVRRTYNSEDDPALTLPGTIGEGWTLNVGTADGVGDLGIGASSIYMPGTQTLFQQVSNPLAVTLVDRDGTRHTFTPRTIGTPNYLPVNIFGPSVPGLTGALHSLVPHVVALTAGYDTLRVDQIYDPPPGVHLGLWRYVEACTAAPPACATPAPAPAVIGYGAETTDRIRYEFNLTGRLVDMVDGSGVELKYLYEATGFKRLQQVYEPRSCTPPAPPTPPATPSPSSCRRIDIEYPDTTHVWVWDPSGNITAGDSTGRKTIYTLDAPATGPAHLLSVANPDGTTLTYTYGCSGGTADQLCKVTDPRGSVTSFAYDTSSNPGAHKMTYTYGRRANTSEFGVSTSTSATALTDSSKHWTSNQWVGEVVQSGSSYGTVISNTATTVVLRRWDNGTTPPASTTYQIYFSDLKILSYAADGLSTTLYQGARVTVFSGIDSAGRVGRLDEGSASAYLRTTLYTWDAAGVATCRKPVGLVDNNLCHRVQLYAPGSPNTSAVTFTPGYDEDTSYVYNQEGALLLERKNLSTAVAPGTACSQSQCIDTTYGYHVQNIQASGTSSGTTQEVDDTPNGSGWFAVPFSARGGGNSLFAIVDRTKLVTPRGNQPGASYSTYQTQYWPENNPQVDPNSVPANDGTIPAGAPPAATSCQNPGAGGTKNWNTGSICETDAPLDGTKIAKTRFRYDTSGQKVSMITPKVWDENQANLLYTYYYYYPDTETDLSGNVVAGGWLKAVTDPSPAGAPGPFAFFGYDRAGNVTKTWDRNATAIGAHAPSDLASTMGGGFSQVLHGTMSAPWRYVTSRTDQMTKTTTYTNDANGDPKTVQSPLGNVVTQTFDLEGNLMSSLTPAEPTTAPTSWSYDAWNNQLTATDPNGHLTVTTYDDVDRATRTARTRGPWVSTTDSPGCVQSSAADFPIPPTTQAVCFTTAAYDGTGNERTAQDANGHTTTFDYDAAHRRTRELAPRDATKVEETDTAYDLDGHVVDIYPPNGFPNSKAQFDIHSIYFPGGLLQTKEQHHTNDLNAWTAYQYAYDADGNPLQNTDPNGKVTTYHFNVRDEKDQQTIPRDTGLAYTTTYSYDKAGNTRSVTAPSGGASLITAYSYDPANRLVDTVTGADSDSVDPTSLYVDPSGLVDANGGSNVRTRLVYDADGNIVGRYDAQAFDPREFDAQHQTAAYILANPVSAFMVRVDRDADGRPIAEYSPRADSSRSTHATISGLPDPSTYSGECPLNPTTQVQPAYGSTVQVCITRASYDAVGNVTRRYLPTSSGSDNRYVAISYTDDRLVKSVDSPNPGTNPPARMTTSTFWYDGKGERTASSDANGNQSTTAYYFDGLVQTQTRPPYSTLTHVTGYQYDSNGNVTQVTDGKSQATVSHYFNDNLLMDVTDGAGDKTQYQYDPAGRPQYVFSPSASALDDTNTSGTPTIYKYWDDGLLRSEIVPVNPNGTTTLRETDYGYAPNGQKASQHVFEVSVSGGNYLTGTVQPIAGRDGGTQALTYYNNGLLQGQTGRSTTDTTATGTITNAYDPGGRPLSVSDSTFSSTIQNTYYLDGKLRTANDGSRTTSFTYDGSGSRLGRADDGGAAHQQTVYAYLDAGLPTTMQSTVTGANNFSWTYDSAGRPLTETDPNNQTAAWTWNPDNTLQKKVVANGSGPVATWTYPNYDQNYQLLKQQFAGVGASGGTPVTNDLSYAYDAAHRLQTYTVSGSAAQTITWDHNGNRKNFGTQIFLAADGNPGYNADNTIHALSDSAHPSNNGTFAYNPTGTVQTDGATSSNCYDGFDRLTKFFGSANAACSGTPTSGSTFDGLDRKVTTSGATTTTLHYDGASTSVAVETGTADIPYTLDAGGTPRAVGAIGGSQLLFDDGKGNISTVTNQIDGSVACTVRFDPFGSALSASTSNPCNTGASSNQYYYRAGRLDSASGTYQFGSRTYDPSKASWLQPDTDRTGSSAASLSVGVDPVTANRYGYVNGDPVNLGDPNGHRACAFDGDTCSGSQPHAPKACDKSCTDASHEWICYLVSSDASDQSDCINHRGKYGLPRPAHPGANPSTPQAPVCFAGICTGTGANCSAGVCPPPGTLIVPFDPGSGRAGMPPQCAVTGIVCTVVGSIAVNGTRALIVRINSTAPGTLAVSAPGVSYLRGVSGATSEAPRISIPGSIAGPLGAGLTAAGSQYLIDTLTGGYTENQKDGRAAVNAGSSLIGLAAGIAICALGGVETGGALCVVGVGIIVGTGTSWTVGDKVTTQAGWGSTRPQTVDDLIRDLQSGGRA